MPQAICPLCESTALSIPLDELSWRFTCPVCGIFEIYDAARQSFPNQEHWDETRRLLSKAARKASDDGHPLKLDDKDSLQQAIAMYHMGFSVE